MRRHLPPPLLRPPLLLPRLGSTLLCSARVGSLSFFIRIGWRFRLFDSLPRLSSSNCSASLVAHDGCTAGQGGGNETDETQECHHLRSWFFLAISSFSSSPNFALPHSFISSSASTSVYTVLGQLLCRSSLFLPFTFALPFDIIKYTSILIGSVFFALVRAEWPSYLTLAA
ncbi:unnamed protein product [Hydatigera taeniaeformis]|uniref:TPT domain-containing protein n=1 Tax=Hydatigena taeniaeformis TaxID=6205 RepID=A0A0R3X824_HYDTA|nr:unnamed protein product [Hydatigera taeniaeformis]